MPSQNDVKLHTLPPDVLMHIVVCVADESLDTLHVLEQTCKTLLGIIRSCRSGGKTALPVRLLPDMERSLRLPGGISARRTKNGDITFRKTSVAGDAFVVFDRPVSLLSSYWQFELDVFNGRRIEIGVATRDALRFHSVERASSWSFDCFGRASMAGVARCYGRQMRAGDTLGVLYDVSTASISFLDNGVSMGALPVRHGKKRQHMDVPLYAFVYLPYHRGERVTLKTAHLQSRQAINMRSIRFSEHKWQRPDNLPYANKIIVHTWEETLWYAIDVDVDHTSLAQFWKEVERHHGMSMQLFELIYRGKRLPNTDKLTLRQAGIVLDRRSGTCSSDILLSVPHIVS